MAGGKHAATVACLVCLTDHGALVRAERSYEGDENDEYRCEEGHLFSIDWSAGEAKEPQWPPSDELKAFAASQKTQGGATAS